jgi:hypothetical protein
MPNEVLFISFRFLFYYLTVRILPADPNCVDYNLVVSYLVVNYVGIND